MILGDPRLRRRFAQALALGSMIFYAVLVPWHTVVAGLAIPQAGAAGDDALQILKAMSDYLASQKTISATFDSSLEVTTPKSLERARASPIRTRGQSITGLRFEDHARQAGFSAKRVGSVQDPARSHHYARRRYD